LVPAGTPRGKKILSEQGITVTGQISPNRSSSMGCGGVIAVIIFAAVAMNMLFKDPSSPTKNAAPNDSLNTESGPLSNLAQIARDGAKEIEQKRRLAAKEAGLKFNQEQADKGDSFGLFRMGERYRDGDGVVKDLVTASNYFIRAIAAGSTTASNALVELGRW
jgi:hypothetical protein